MAERRTVKETDKRDNNKGGSKGVIEERRKS